MELEHYHSATDNNSLNFKLYQKEASEGHRLTFDDDRLTRSGRVQDALLAVYLRQCDNMSNKVERQIKLEPRCHLLTLSRAPP